MSERERRRRPFDVDVEELLQPAERKALDALQREHGERIAEALASDAEVAELLVTDPVRAIASLGIEIPRELKRFGRAEPRAADPFRRRGVRLADGTVLPVNVRVRFTGGRR